MRLVMPAAGRGVLDASALQLVVESRSAVLEARARIVLESPQGIALRCGSVLLPRVARSEP